MQLPDHAKPRYLQPTRLKALTLEDREEDVVLSTLLTPLLRKTTPLSPSEREDLQVLLSLYGDQVQSHLPETLTVRETLGLIYGTLLKHHPEAAFFEDHIRPALKTATDLLRVLVVFAEAHEGLHEKIKRLPRLNRPLRKSMLGFLAALQPLNLLEDLQRYPGLWKRLGEVLHPYDYATHFPDVALAFAILRKTPIDAETPLGQLLLERARFYGRRVQLRGNTLHHVSWSGELEALLLQDDLSGLLRLLQQRPGEFGRKLDVLIRKATAQDQMPLLQDQFQDMLPRISPTVLLTLQAHLQARSHTLFRRVFFPKGTSGIVYHAPDQRPVLSSKVTAPLVQAIEQELLRRAALLPALPSALLDQKLQDITVPFNEKSTSRALVTLPRGSVLDIPEGRHFRLFLHWMQAEGQHVDLDLSVGFYDRDFKMVQCCDFTSLRLPKGSAVHSGDLTSAPAPLGASEFIDLDFDLLQEQGAHYAIMMVFSYNRVPFENLPEAFAGLMLCEPAEGPAFDPRTVQQRFDLTGKAQVALPLLLDLNRRTLRWLDVKMTPSKSWNSIRGYQKPVEALGRGLQQAFHAHARPTLWQLFCLHAAARCQNVTLVGPEGRLKVLSKAEGEDVHAFYHRLLIGKGGVSTADHAGAGLVAVLHADGTVAPGSEVYSLFPGPLSAAEVHFRKASDWVADLKGKG